MPDGIASRFNQVAYDAQDERHLAGVPLLPSGNLSARGGVRPGQSNIVTVGGSPEAWTVAAHSGVIEGPTDTDGAYTYAIQAAVSGTLPARPGAGLSRKDILVARILDADVPATGSTLREVDVQHIAGTETSGTPAAPTAPAGSLLLSTLTVPATGAITLTQPPRTVASGGILPVANATERNAVGRMWDGLVVYREDTDAFEARVNGAWRQVWQEEVFVDLSNGALTRSPGQAPARISWDTTHEATGGASLTSGSRINLPVGVYHVDCMSNGSWDLTWPMQLELRRNSAGSATGGSQVIMGYFGDNGAGNRSALISKTIRMAANDHLEVWLNMHPSAQSGFDGLGGHANFYFTAARI